MFCEGCTANSRLRVVGAVTALLLTLAALAASVQPTPSMARAVALTPVDGGVNYHARFSHGLPTSRSYFPIGVWLESVSSQADVNRDKDAGLNLYVTVTANSSLPEVSSAGMHVIAQQSEWRTRETEPGAAAMTGWELADEIDMLGSPESGYSTLKQIHATLPADGRLRFNNYAKGVTFWLTDKEAARYVNEFQDVLSADNYWFTDENICSGTEGGTLVAGGADWCVGWSAPRVRRRSGPSSNSATRSPRRIGRRSSRHKSARPSGRA